MRDKQRQVAYMAASVGEIGLDLVVNQKPFNKQMSGVTGLAKKAGAALAGAFALKQIVDFGKECVNLGSDLQEVQNVVDVTFPKMKQKVNEFAKGAASSFGLSETMAKKFTGTFGSMAKSFGFSEKESYKMSTALTGLAGDVASFYNLSQDEAYTKLKSVFTGETESLKDLGVVMTQSALDSYALANGYGKVTAKMSEQEKVALRYKFVTEQLTAASGDFLRTSDGWANQTRLLSLQFDSLKASIGQGLINVLTPVIKVVNSVLQKLTVLGSKFAELTGQAFGKQDASGTAESVDEISAAADNASSGVAGIGDAAKKSAKQAERATMSFDKFNKISSPSSDSSSGGAAAGGKEAASAPKADTPTKSGGGALDNLKKQFEATSKLFAKGFSLGAGNIGPAVQNIKKHLLSIGSSLKDIFTDKNVQAAVQKMILLWTINFGKTIGAITSIGATIAENLLGGIDLFFQANKDRVKQWLISMFNINGEIDTIRANFWVAVADIFSVFREYDAKLITADLISILWSGFSGTTELLGKIGRDILNLITQPIIDNKDKLKEAIRNTIKPVSSTIHTIAEAVQSTWDKIQAVYDNHVKPLIDSLAEGISGWMETVLDKYNEYIAPVLDKLSKRFKEVMDSHIKPAIDKVITTVGKWCDTLKNLWEKWLQPLVNWCIEKIVPVFAKVFEEAGEKIQNIIAGISDAIKGIGEAFSGICSIIQGIVDGDWSKVWSGVKETVSGILNSIKGYFSAAWNAIKLTFSPAIAFFKNIWSKIKDVFGKVKDFFSTTFSAAWTVIKTVFSLETAKEFFGKIWTGIKNSFGSVSDWFKDTFSNAWQKVKDVFSTGGKVFSGIKDGIADVFKTVVNKLISGINTVISVPFKKINDMLNTIHDVSILGAKPFSSLWDKNPLPTPQIPKLASGGYVKANTPQLAMIGDNRHQGEVVAPEDKMLEMARQAAELSGGTGMTAKVIELLEKIISILENLDLDVYVDGEKVSRNMVKHINRHTKQTGRLEIVIK